MSLITLLKANIKHRKGTFISITFLMILVTMSITAILSISDNYSDSFDEAFKQVNSPSIVVFADNRNLSDELIESVRNHKNVSDIKNYATVTTTEAVIGNTETKTNWFMEKLRDNYLVMNDSLNGYKDKTPDLKKGEIYIPLGIKTNMPCEIGDTVTVTTIAKDYEFKIAGFVVEPSNGSSFIGWKQVFISDEDFNRISADCKEAETESLTSDYHALYIYKSADCDLSDQEFRRTLNLDTGVVDRGIGSLTKQMSKNYSTLMPRIIIGVLTVFVCILFVVVVIVMNNSITTGIEMDYVNLGILKSQGFTQGRLRVIVGFQYILAQIIGAIIGILLAIPLNSFLGGIFQPVTAIICSNDISVLKAVLVIIGILAISVLFIIMATRKIGKIAPVRALCGGRETIHFDSRLKAPISKKGLSASLAIRQFTSNKRQYIGVISIVAILVFFMITILSLAKILSADSAMEAMGQIPSDIYMTVSKDFDNAIIDEMEDIIEKHSAINKKYHYNFNYSSINGDDYACLIFEKSDMITGILKGRAPLYDNEISISEIAADELKVKIGDKVTVANNDKKEEYIISGLHQNMTDAGLNAIINLEGAKQIGLTNLTTLEYAILDDTKTDTIVAEINDKYPDLVEAVNSNSRQSSDEVLDIAILAVKTIIYTLSVIFALVVVVMTCSKTFLQERNDIGIYKALGFTSTNLRTQFAIRFLLVAVIGSIVGSLLCIVFSKNLISIVLRLIGISSFKVLFDFSTIFIPVALICLCFFIFSYLVSGRIKRVAVKELVVK